MGAGRKRFQRVPSFTKQLFTYSSSTSSGAPASSALRSALAMALRKTFSMCLAARLGVKRSVCSAAFTACPLKVRVGENSPSLCPIICSVTYTGMNFLPLCTAMVWPIISGTIVDRRDQVFTTFFSLRVFRPSTFSRRWPSTNGPFFSERAISLGYSSTLRKRLHCARRIFLKPRTGPGTRCDLGQNGHTKRVPCALGMRSTMTDQPGLHSLYSTGSGGAITTFTGRTGLLVLTAVRFAGARFTGRLVRRLAVRPVRVVLVARMVFYSHRAAVRRRPGSLLVFTSLLPTLNDLLVRTLVPARLLAQRRESPGRLRVITLDLAFSSAVRMIHRVHGHAAHGGLDAAPPGASGLAKRFILMVKVANLANRGHAIDGKLAHFAAGHLHQRKVAFFAEQLRRATCRANGLSAASRVQLEVVHHRAGRNVANLQRVAGKNVRAFAGLHRGANFEPHRMDDVALLAIGVMQQRDIRAAIGVIFDGRNFCRHTDFVAPEIHLAVLLLVAAPAMPNHNFAVIVASAGSLFRLKQGFLRFLLGDMAFVQDGDKPPRRRIWIKAFKSHRRLLPSYFLLQRNAVCAYKFSAYSIIFSPSASFT